MVRFISSALILALLFFIIGRCQLNNATVGMGLTIHDTLSFIHIVKNKVERYKYDHQKLPNSNRDIKAPPPHQYADKSKLLRDIEVLENGVVYVRFTSENKGMPVELVYTPIPTSKYALKWKCESYNLTQQWRSTIPEVCSETSAPFDKERHVKTDTDSYIQKVTQRQREKAEQSQAVKQGPSCNEIAAADNSFVHVNSQSLTSMDPISNKTFLTTPRPENLNYTAHLGLQNYLVYYAGNTLFWLTPEAPTPKASSVFLNNPTRFIRQGDFFWSNSGPGLATISLCDKAEPSVKTQYPMKLGAYSIINDFRVMDNFAFLSTSQKGAAALNSALQIVQLLPNKNLGFLKLEGKTHGLAIKDRYAYIAHDRFGISIVDIFDITLPRLLHREATKDAAMDILPMGKFLLVADRLAGISTYLIDGKNILHVESQPTEFAAIQLRQVSNQTISVIFKNGQSALFEWDYGKLKQINVN